MPAAVITVKSLVSDLSGAALAATEHFRQVGVNANTVRTFVLNCREAGIKISRSGNTLLLSY